MQPLKDYHEHALAFVDSADMRECLRKALLVSEDPDKDCLDYIVGSCANIDDKLAALRQIPPCEKTAVLIRAAEIALAERESVEGSVFRVRSMEDGQGERQALCVSFDRALRIANDNTTAGHELDADEWAACMKDEWHEITKYVPDENGDLKDTVTWSLNARGEIMFFSRGCLRYSGFGEMEDTALKICAEWRGSGWWEPAVIPFDFGDIITIDTRPFGGVDRGVVAGIYKYGPYEPKNSPALVCICVDDDGYLYCEDDFSLAGTNSKISPFYRAARYTDELPDRAGIFKTISEAIRKTPSTEQIDGNGAVWRSHELAGQMVKAIADLQKHKRRNVLWDELKDRFPEVLTDYQVIPGRDTLAFEKVWIPPVTPGGLHHKYTGDEFVVRPIINGRSYVGILQPLLNWAGEVGYGGGQMHLHCPIGWLYDTLVKLLNPKEEDRVVRLVWQLGVYDAAAPHWAKVENDGDSVVWTCHCPHNTWFSDEELPVFRFDGKQYREALDQLKTIADGVITGEPTVPGT